MCLWPSATHIRKEVAVQSVMVPCCGSIKMLKNIFSVVYKELAIFALGRDKRLRFPFYAGVRVRGAQKTIITQLTDVQSFPMYSFFSKNATALSESAKTFVAV